MHSRRHAELVRVEELDRPADVRMPHRRPPRRHRGFEMPLVRELPPRPVR